MRTVIASAVGVVCACAGTAAAQSGGVAPQPQPANPPPDSTTEDAPRTERNHKRIRLRTEAVSPRRFFFRGSAGTASFKYELAGGARRDVVIEVMRKRKRRRRAGGGSREPVQRWVHDDMAPGEPHVQKWGGKRAGKGRASSGRYVFRVRAQGGRLAKRPKRGRRSVGYYEHIFPVRGRHKYGDGIGAPRSGHRHRGQDVFARCGAALVAARAGKVQYKGYQGGGAGHYVVIDGRRTGRDYAYMHLKGKARVRRGEHVRTGQRIGRVGRSGNASGCHLHFELWSKPGWYEGGRYLRSVTRQLRKWDRWS